LNFGAIVKNLQSENCGSAKVKFTKKRFLIPVVIIFGLAALLIRYSGLLTSKADFVSSYEIGDLGPSGGNIFYIDEFSEHKDFDYLESAPGNCEGVDLVWALDANDLSAGLKVVTENGWFAARPSGTEEIYKIYAESFIGESHLNQIIDEAQTIVSTAFNNTKV
jgi:hypothetical protein